MRDGQSGEFVICCTKWIHTPVVLILADDWRDPGGHDHGNSLLPLSSWIQSKNFFPYPGVCMIMEIACCLYPLGTSPRIFLPIPEFSQIKSGLACAMYLFFPRSNGEEKRGQELGESWDFI